ncbi:MAG TPA: aspartate kinase, partial [Vicinamibacteria bacterium]
DRHGVPGKQLLYHEAPAPDGSASVVMSLENVHDFPRLRSELTSRLPAGVRLCEGLGAVSAIGTGINATFENLRRCLTAVADLGVTLRGVSTSSFRISLVVDEPRVTEVVRRLHADLVTRSEEEPA